MTGAPTIKKPIGPVRLEWRRQAGRNTLQGEGGGVVFIVAPGSGFTTAWTLTATPAAPPAPAPRSRRRRTE